jgi:phenylacetate-coenzyme A ligase PaaK-like adenylate-forming protein
MPLIRYDTGDLARRPRSRTCGCGAADQFVDRLEGRGDIRLRDARGKLYLTYEPLSILDTCGIADFQIVQRVPGQVRIVLPAGSTTSEDRRDRAEARLHEYFNHAMDVEFAASGGFVLTASGKRNAVVAESVTHP